MRALLALLLVMSCYHVGAEEVDSKTGLVIAPGFEAVNAQCTACHSGRLVAQNRADREGWLAMIRWMQETQGLWPLGDKEVLVLDYLSPWYGPLKAGRRQPLSPELLPPEPS